MQTLKRSMYSWAFVFSQWPDEPLTATSGNQGTAFLEAGGNFYTCVKAWVSSAHTVYLEVLLTG